MLAKLQSLEFRKQRHLIETLQSADRTQVDQQARQKLADVLTWCKDTVPAYRARLKQWPEDAIREDPERVLTSLPILEKNDIREHSQALRSDKAPRTGVRTNRSGGSTGEPLALLQDRIYRRWNRAGSTVFESWAGFRPGQRKAILWGVPRDLAAGRKPSMRLRNRLQNRHLLDAYCMSREAMDRYTESLRSRPPSLLRCLAQSGTELARHVLQRGETLRGIGAVISTGGVLHGPEREWMERAFGAPVFNLYGSREVGPIACEISPGGPMKVIPLIHHVELLDADGGPVAKGESGDIVATLLTNRTMPLLRYRIGDRGRWADIPENGPAWPALAAIEGRVMGHFVTTDGALVNGEYFTHLMYEQPWIRKFQWIQHAREVVELKAVPANTQPPSVELAEIKDHLLDACRKILGPEVTLELTIVDHIQPSPSGKHHYTISNVPRP